MVVVLELEEVGFAEAETSVAVGGLTLITEYFVTVVVLADGETVTSTVLVVSDPLMVDIMKSVVIDWSVSVSMIVFVSGAGVAVTVSIIVDAIGLVVVDDADPPSTGTTEYVALLTRGSNQACSPWMRKNGSDEPKQKSDDATKSVEVEVLRRMMRNGEESNLDDLMLVR